MLMHTRSFQHERNGMTCNHLQKEYRQDKDKYNLIGRVNPQFSNLYTYRDLECRVKIVTLKEKLNLSPFLMHHTNNPHSD